MEGHERATGLWTGHIENSSPGGLLQHVLNTEDKSFRAEFKALAEKNPALRCDSRGRYVLASDLCRQSKQLDSALPEPDSSINPVEGAFIRILQ